MLLDLIVVLLAAALNRVRGGGLGAGALPGHPRLWASAGMLLPAALAGHDWTVAAVWAVGFLAWAAMPLNRWDVLGRVEQTDWPNKIEEAVEAISFNLGPLPYAYGPLMVRECVGILPALFWVGWVAGPWWLFALAPVYAVAAVGMTELAHRAELPRFRVLSEPLVGVLWGLLLIIG